MPLHWIMLEPRCLYWPITLWSVIPLFNNYSPLLSGIPQVRLRHLKGGGPPGWNRTLDQVEQGDPLWTPLQKRERPFLIKLRTTASS